MKCRDCGFDDKEPIAYIMGFKEVWPHDRGKIMSDANLRAASTVTKNGVLQSYHLAHKAGAVKCKIEKDGWMYSAGVFVNENISRMN